MYFCKLICTIYISGHELQDIIGILSVFTNGKTPWIQQHSLKIEGMDLHMELSSVAHNCSAHSKKMSDIL